MSADRCFSICEQVLFDILLHLPVTSLLRFKAVCKDWFSLIESSAFISEHIIHNLDNKKDSFIILGHNKDKSVKRNFALLFGNQYEECVYDIYNGQSWKPTRKIQLICCCDGIVCLAHKNEIALWNPALKQLKPIPQPLFSNRLALSDWYSISTSLGIDIKRNDFKLVRILLLYSDRDDLIGNQVETYNLGGEKTWRIINKDDVLPFNEISTFNAVSSCKTGKCFWIAWKDDNIPILLSFDFNGDVFNTMLLPYGNQDLILDGHVDLDFLDDKVVYIASDNHFRNIEIWLLHEFGVEKSWNMMYKIRPLLYFDCFHSMRISKNGEFLICIKSDTAVGEYMFYLYNLYTKQGKFHQNCNLDPCLGQLIHYNASLLSLKSE